MLSGNELGALIGALVQYFDVQPFIASLAGLFLARGFAFVVSLSSIRVEDPVVLWLQSTRLRIGDWYLTPTGIIALLVVAIAAAVLRWTRFGRTVYAIGGSEQSARLMGLAVGRTKVIVYLISGVSGISAGRFLVRCAVVALLSGGLLIRGLLSGVRFGRLVAFLGGLFRVGVLVRGSIV